MGYLFLTLSLIAGGIKGYCGKRMSGAVASSSDSMIINCFRMCLCAVIGFVLILFQSNHLPSFDAITLLISILSGLSTAVFVVSWLMSVRTSAYMMVEVFLLIGATVPISLCYFIFDEQITPKQIVAILMLLVAVFIMCTYNASLKGNMWLSELILPVICGASYGLSDFSQKLYVKAQHSGSVLEFNLYTYLVSAAILVLAFLLFRRLDKQKTGEMREPLSVIKPVWIYILIMAVCLFANSFFKTEAARFLDSVQLYPLSQGASVIMSLILSSVFFKERINKRCVFGISLAFISLLILNT